MKELLKGEESLVTAFWFVGIGYLLLAAGMFGLVMLSESMIMLGVFIISMIAYFIFYEVSIWKCSNNCSWIGWANLARFIVITRAIVFPISFFLKMFISAEIGNAINWYSNIFEISLGALVLIAFLFIKVSGGKLSAPADTEENGKVSNESYLKDAKTKFLAGDYEGALVLFNTADSIEKLDENSKSFQNMCLRRLNKHNKSLKSDAKTRTL
jgi:hypothetical protein